MEGCWVESVFFWVVVGLCSAVAVAVGFYVKIYRYLSGGWVFVRVVAIGFGVFIFIIFNLMDRSC